MDSFNARVVARKSTGDGEGHSSPGGVTAQWVCAVFSPQRGARCAILVHLRDGCELHDIASKNRVCDQRFVFLSREDADPRFLDTLARQQ